MQYPLHYINPHPPPYTTPTTTTRRRTMGDSPSHVLLPEPSSVIDLSGVPLRPRPYATEDDDDQSEDEEQKNKKRRLTVEQVQSLERSFEVDNKLEPDRKNKLASELNLRPRQVAIWFQNRRARSKTKQLQRDYATLKSHCDHLANHNNHLQNEVSFLKDKLNKMEGKSVAGATTEETISDVLSSGSTSQPGFIHHEEMTASCLMAELGKALETDFQMGAGASGFGLPGFDFEPSFDPSYWSWLY